MPLSGGTSGAHDDAMHQGSAKRDTAGGVGGLDASGFLLAKGAGIAFPRTGSDDVHIYERTSGEEAYAFHRVGADDYTFYIKESNVWKRFQTESMKDVVNGIAALDAGGHVLAPGYRFTAARGAAEQITIRERTSGERVFRWIRIGADDYEARVNVGGVEKVVQHAGLKGAANGIAGLDAGSKVLLAQIPDAGLTVAIFQVNAATGTAGNPADSNDNNTVSEADFDTVNKYIEVNFSARYMVTEFRHYGNTINTGDGRYKIQHYINGRWVDNTLDIPVRVTGDWSGWVSLTTQIYTSRIRLVCTTVDSWGASMLPEIEMR